MHTSLLLIFASHHFISTDDSMQASVDAMKAVSSDQFFKGLKSETEPPEGKLLFAAETLRRLLLNLNRSRTLIAN